VIATIWPALLLFVMLVLSVSLYGLTVSGHFPGEHRGAALRTGGGAAILWGTMATTAVAALFSVAFAARTLPWYVAIISGGGALLIAPLLLQPLPDAFVDGRRGLLTFSALAILLAAVAWRFG
jgi:hypothetical protein